MTDVFIDTLHSWQNFYFMIGGAAAGLMGLMFVALSLGMGLLDDKTRADFPAFVTPSILYFVSTLLAAGVMLVPSYTPSTLGVVLFLGGAVGLLRASQHVRHLIRAANQYQDFALWDWLTQIILPITSYVLALLSALGFVVNQWSLAFVGMWLTTLFLLLCGIANTWSLVLWIIDNHIPR